MENVRFAATPSDAATSAFTSASPLLAETEDRRQVLLLVQDEPLVGDVAVKVNGELRHAETRAVEAHEPCVERRAVTLQDRAAGEAEVAIEPRVE